MTFDPDNNSSNAEEATTKPVRRRVTRATAAPVIKPVQFLTADTPAPVAPKTTSGGAAVATPTTITSDDSATVAAPRRSRRVTSSGKATGGSVAVTGTATEIAAQATSAQERVQADAAKSAAEPASVTTDTPQRAKSTRAKSGTKKGASKNLKSVVENAAEVSQPALDVFGEANETKAPSESAPATETRKARTRTGRAAQSTSRAAQSPSPLADNVSDSAQETGKSESAQDRLEDSGSERVTKNNARSRTRTRTRTAQDATVSQPEAKDEAATESSTGKDDKPTQRRNSRGRKNNVFSDARNEQVATVEPVVEEAAAPQRPRLATTALLFQAPDLSAVPARSVGAPIISAEEPAEEADETEEVAEAQEEQGETRQNSRNNRRERGRNRNNRSRPRAEDETEEPEAVEVAPNEDESADSESDIDHDSAELDGDDEGGNSPRRRRRRGGRGRRNRTPGNDSTEDETDEPETDETDAPEDSDENVEESDGDEYSSSRRRRRRRRRGSDSEGTTRNAADEVTALKGSTRLEAKRQRRREGRDAGRRRTIITEAEFLARRESVERSMIVRERAGRTQIAVLEDGVLVEHYVSQQSQTSMAGNVYLGRVQNVLPSMEAAFVDIGKGRNAVLYAGEVNWDVHGLDGQPRRIEDALKSGDTVLVQVTKDPIGHKGARLTSQVTLAGRYLVYVPGGGMTGISRKLPDVERTRLKRILRDVVPEGAGVIVRTAAEGASEEELTADIARLRSQWENIEKKSKSANAPALLQGEPDLAIRVVRDIFNDDFKSLKVQGDNAWNEISEYVNELAPDLAERVSKWVEPQDIFSKARIDEQLTKGMDRKVWLPSGGSLVIDRTEAMTVVDVNTGKFTGVGGTLEETVTRNNIEAAEEIVRQLRLRDIGGIIVIDFIDMVLESNRDLVLRRLVECLGRDRTKHQVAEVTSLGLVQMTRKRVGQGLVEAFSTNCDHCNGRGFVVHEEPNEKQGQHTHNNSPVVVGEDVAPTTSKRARRKRNANKDSAEPAVNTESAVSAESVEKLDRDSSETDAVKAKLATIAAAAAHAHDSEDVAASTESTEKKTSAVEVASAENSVDKVDSPQPSNSAQDTAAQSNETTQSESAAPSGNSEQSAVADVAVVPVAPVLDVLAEFGFSKD